MRIIEIIVNAGRTLQHPCESYANIRPEVTLKASISPEDDATECTRQLQCKAEQLVEQHAMVLRASLLERQVAERENDELARLMQSISANQQRVEQLQDSINQRVTKPENLLF